MPSTVAEVFAAAQVAPAGEVAWGTPVPLDAPGVYVVALTDDPGSGDAVLAEPPIDGDALERLLSARPELRLDGARPGIEELEVRLRAFWLAEGVLYVGLAGTSLRKRVGQYHRTPLGARRPHAGGWWLKTLTVLDEPSGAAGGRPPGSADGGRTRDATGADAAGGVWSPAPLARAGTR